MSNSTESEHYDVIIQGGAYVGLSLALAIKKSCSFLKVLLVEARDNESFQQDERSFAVAAAAVRMLTQLGVWNEIADKTQPILEMVITDSRLNDPVRPVFLTFSGEIEPGEAFAHMLETKILIEALYRHAQEAGVEFAYQSSVTNFFLHENNLEAEVTCLKKGKRKKIISKLLIAADGTRSPLREKANIKQIYFPYKQTGIVCTIEHERPHHGRAEEHFLPAGPFAILPLKGNRSSLVWNEDPAYADILLKANKLVFETALEQRFGHHLGALKLTGGRYGFPFGLRLSREFVKKRFALVGDSAHTIHPISGQGLNLGFRDVALLAELVVDQARLGLDIGGDTLLQRYQAGRRFETVRMGITTDILNRLFSNDNEPLRFIRDFGLGLVEQSPSLKNYFIKEAAGVTKGSPRLLLGQPL